MADDDGQGLRRAVVRTRARAISLPVRHGGVEGWRGHLMPWFEHRWHRLQALIALELEHRTPFLWLPVAFGLGILAYFALPQEPLWWHGPMLAFVAAVPAALDTGSRRVLGITLLMAALGFTAATWRTMRVHTPMLSRDMITEVRGFVETLDPGQGRMRLTLRTLSIADVPPGATPAGVRIGAPSSADVAPGDFIVLRARLSPPSEASMPGGYDFRRDAYFKGIGGVGYALGKPVVIPAPAPLPRDLVFNAWIDSGRNWLTARIANAIGGQAGALSAALITGKRGLISESTNDDLRASGLYHIVSISGIHMVLAAGVLFWSVRAFLATLPGLALGWPIKKIAAVFAMAGSGFYCVFSGSEVATERSLIMTWVMLGAILADRPALAMRNLAISALLVLAREPESLIGPSFQMSFAAVACLIGANRVWQNWRRAHPPREWGALGRLFRTAIFLLLGIGATTLVATLATGPFSVFHFHRINPFGLIGNALALPLVSIIVMPAAVIGTLLSPLDLDWIVWRIMGEGVSGVLFVAERVGALENASYAVARLSIPAFGLMVLALLLFVNLQSKLRALGLVPLALLPLVPMHPPLPDMVIDPHGKSALVRTQDGRFHLLSPEAANRFTLAQWLPALGDNRTLRDKSLRSPTSCDKTGCTLKLNEWRTAALSLTPLSLREDCARADVLITPLLAPKSCAARHVFDKTHFERHGSSFVLFGAQGDLTITAALDDTAHRPWRRAQPTGPHSGLGEPPLARWLNTAAWPQRADGRRFFGLLPPAHRAQPDTATPATDEDPALMPEKLPSAPRDANEVPEAISPDDNSTGDTPPQEPLSPEAPQ